MNQLFLALAEALKSAESDDAVRDAVFISARSVGQDLSTHLSTLALDVAERVVAGEVNYDEAMRFTADVHSAFLASGEMYDVQGDSVFASVYWALDEGEYGHEIDGERGPIEARVLPTLRKIIREQNATASLRASNEGTTERGTGEK